MKRYLTKSRYKLGLECPTKLFYTNKPKEYANVKVDDPFLMALADGGFQVEALARLEYPDGVLIEAENYEYQKAIDQTDQLLLEENCVIFEAAFAFENLFIRTDILVKRGNSIQLIEVKAKSFDPTDSNVFEGKRGSLTSEWKSYLFDVAFQQYVLQKAYPNYDISSYLKLPDKTKTAIVDGLNQLFRISKDGDKRKDTKQLVHTVEEIGATVLTDVCVDAYVRNIHSGKHKYSEDFTFEFEDGIQFLADHYERDVKINFPINFSTCKKCEFKKNESNLTLKSGFEICLKEQLKLTDQELLKPKTFDVWSFKSGKNLFKNDNVLFMEDLSKELFPLKLEVGKISNSERQWLQIEKAISNDDSNYVLKQELKLEMEKWKFPYHFIDFETSAVALPFNKGRKPYEQVAFQFSYHILYENGKIEHANQFICDESGMFPNFEFVRALKKALGDKGSIFKYSNHENSILNSIYNQLKESLETDKNDLMDFIKIITQSKKDSVEQWDGERNMIDLCEVYKRYYFDPHTKGSNSIKAVLPALLKRSNLLQIKYSKTIQEIGLSSLNFPETHCWLFEKEGLIQNPYKQLPPVFDQWTEEELESLLSNMEDISNGGAALTAYGFLQYTDITPIERKSLVSALLKYCELDTLAMVMLVEHFIEVTK